MPVLENVSLRIVGVYLRVNDPYNHAVTPPDGAPGQIDLPTITVPDDEPKVLDVMTSISTSLEEEGYIFSFLENGPAGAGILNQVTYETPDESFRYNLNAADLMTQTGITFAWQYYIFEKNLDNPYDDTRIPVINRATYGSIDSPTIQSDYRIIWRLVPIDKTPQVGQKMSYTPK